LLGWAVLCFAVLGCALLGCALLCCAGLCFAVLHWAVLGWASLGCALLGWALLCCAGWASLGWAGLTSCIAVETSADHSHCVQGTDTVSTLLVPWIGGHFQCKNMQKQFYQTAFGNCYGLKFQNADCSVKK